MGAETESSDRQRRLPLWVATLSWEEVARRQPGAAGAILPVGAACKEHGYHLPLNTDFLQAEWFAAKAARRFGLLVWPTLSYGYYPAFIDYPGSISLSRATFVAAAQEVIEGILRAGVARVFVLNTGVSTIAPLQEAVAASVCPNAVLLINIYQGSHYLSSVAELEEQAFGGHADEIETSIMLAIAPREVSLSRAIGSSKPIAAGVLNRSHPDGANYSPSGATGEPRLASTQKGEIIVEAILADLEQGINQALEGNA
ncbi:MAG: creatininase family protein [Gammaproteobacteria bacterium]